jgi:hypothetical protein
MMPSNFSESQPSLSPRSIKATFNQPLPEGCCWTLWAENQLLANGKVELSQRSSLLVTTTYTGDVVLKLIIDVPNMLGQSIFVQERVGGLVIIDNLETTQCDHESTTKVKSVA